MGKIHEAYGQISKMTETKTVLGVQCNYPGKTGECYHSEYDTQTIASDYAPPLETPEWLDDDKLTKVKFYRRLNSLGWTFTRRRIRDSLGLWTDENHWLCPSCNTRIKAGER
jgi:hypothetical protein